MWVKTKSEFWLCRRWVVITLWMSVRVLTRILCVNVNVCHGYNIDPKTLCQQICLCGLWESWTHIFSTKNTSPLWFTIQVKDWLHPRYEVRLSQFTKPKALKTGLFWTQCLLWNFFFTTFLLCNTKKTAQSATLTFVTNVFQRAEKIQDYANNPQWPDRDQMSKPGAVRSEKHVVTCS